MKEPNSCVQSLLTNTPAFCLFLLRGWKRKYNVSPSSNSRTQGFFHNLTFIGHQKWLLSLIIDICGWSGTKKGLCPIEYWLSLLHLFNHLTLQDPGTEPAKRIWSSINVGTEIYVSQNGVTAEWSVSDFNVLVPEDVTYDGEITDQVSVLWLVSRCWR